VSKLSAQECKLKAISRKSQLAIRYGYSIREERPDCPVFWVQANDKDRFVKGYEEIAALAQIPGWDTPKVDVLDLVHRWLRNENNGRWVMIIDNADDEAVIFDPVDGENDNSTPSTTKKEHPLSDYIPQVAHGSIVITSRSRDVPFRFTDRPEDIIEVPAMDLKTSLVLLGKKLDVDAAEDELVDLALSLDRIPLAITQAAAHINRRTRMTVSKYLQIFRRNDTDRKELLLEAYRDPRRDRHAPSSIITTWHLSFTHIREIQPSAGRLLALMSLFDREAIPEALLHGCREYDGAGAQFEEDIDLLRSYCLIGLSNTDDAFEMHQLVQFSTQKWIEQHKKLRYWRRRYIETMCKAFPTEDPTGDSEVWKKCESLFPHAATVVSYRPKNPQYLKQWAQILYFASRYAGHRGKYEIAESMARKSLDVFEGTSGIDNRDAINSLTNLATILYYWGKYKAAEKIQRRALEASEKFLGEKNPDTLKRVSNLAQILLRQGNFKAAEALQKRVVKGREEGQIEDNHDTLISSNNQAVLLQAQGKYELAEKLIRRALPDLTTTTPALSEDHIITLNSIENLANILECQGKYDAAEEMGRRAFEGFKKILGEENADTLRSLAQLASILHRRGEYEAAAKLYHQANEGCVKALDEEHPVTLTIACGLALALSSQGNYVAAEQIGQQALKLSCKVHGREHHDTFKSADRLALVLHKQGKIEAAEEMFRWAQEGRRKLLGLEHPLTIDSTSNLAAMLFSRGSYDEAHQLLVPAIEASKKTIGKEHPETLRSMNNLAWVHLTQGRLEEAEQLGAHVLETSKRSSGENHPDTLAFMSTLSHILNRMGSRTEALSLMLDCVGKRVEVLGLAHPDTVKTMEIVERWANI
jgi:tetratricopeptide (TPR) repeat protein